jgi:hypothetical protein
VLCGGDCLPEIFAFTEIKKVGKSERESIIVEDDHGVFALLCNSVEGESGNEKILQPFCYGSDNIISYHAGVDITFAMLTKYNTGTTFMGKTI